MRPGALHRPRQTRPTSSLLARTKRKSPVGFCKAKIVCPVARPGKSRTKLVAVMKLSNSCHSRDVIGVVVVVVGCKKEENEEKIIMQTGDKQENSSRHTVGISFKINT